MKLSIFIVGKNNFDFVEQGMKMYHDRLVHFADITINYIPEPKYTTSTPALQIKEKESSAIMKALFPADFVILLDEKGKEFTSKNFAAFLEKKLQLSGKRIVFIIGGSYGFSQELYNRANDLLSLSKLTFTHQMARVFFAEQLYRAFTIMKGIPYHHE